MDKAKFIKAKAEGKTNKQAALEANPDLKPDSAEVVGSRLSKNPEIKLMIQKTAQQAMIDANISSDDLIQTLKEASTAVKPVIYGKGDDAVLDILPDWTARLKATDMLLKLQQAYTPTKEDEPVKQLQPQDLEALKKRIDKGDVAALERIVFKEQ
jgi:hypothetical protein